MYCDKEDLGKACVGARWASMLALYCIVAVVRLCWAVWLDVGAVYDDESCLRVQESRFRGLGLLHWNPSFEESIGQQGQ